MQKFENVRAVLNAKKRLHLEKNKNRILKYPPKQNISNFLE